MPHLLRRVSIALAVVAGALIPAPAAGADELDWTPCGDRFQCADLEMPLDYSRP